MVSRNTTSTQSLTEQKTIIGGWLIGEHMEDMDKLTSSDLPNLAHIGHSIRKNGANVFQVAKDTNTKITDLTEMTSLYTDSLYQMAMANIMDAKARHYLANVTSDVTVPEIIETLKGFEVGEVINIPPPEKDWTTRYLDELDRRKKQKLVTTGLSHLDSILCGIRPKELTAVAARPAVGKSAFALQIAIEIAKQGEKVLYFPLEMSTEQTVERMMLRYVTISQMDLRRGDVDWKEVNVATDRVYKLEKGGNFLIFESCNDLNVIAELVRKHKPSLVVIDQLEQMRASGEVFKDKRTRFSHMTNQLKRLSMTENTHVMLLCQLNRAAEAVEPKLSDLKESGSIEEDSDNVILLHRIQAGMSDESEWNDNNRAMIVKVAKQRSGATGDVQCEFVANKYTFYDVRTGEQR